MGIRALLWVFWIVAILYSSFKRKTGLFRAFLLALAIYSFASAVTTTPFSVTRVIFCSLISAIFLYIRYRYEAMIPESDLFNAGNAMVAVYVLRTPAGYVAFDSGLEGSASTFLALINDYGIAVSEIKYFFITHTHPDHVGALAELCSLVPAAKVIGIEETFTRLKAGVDPGVAGARVLGWPGKVIWLLSGGKTKPARFPAIDVPDERRIVFDGKRQILREFGIAGDILLLPGHSADSIGLLLDDGRLFCGDATMNGLPGEGRHAFIAENVDEYHHSWDVMIGSTAKWIYPAHGTKFPVNDLVEYRHTVDGRESVVTYIRE
jgi:glyoxylase-like metal-dependent hydrolase (beta-lactamase superfamily II)